MVKENGMTYSTENILKITREELKKKKKEERLCCW